MCKYVVVRTLHTALDVQLSKDFKLSATSEQCSPRIYVVIFTIRAPIGVRLGTPTFDPQPTQSDSIDRLTPCVVIGFMYILDLDTAATQPIRARYRPNA
jgi:hypothetical protein